MKILIVGEKRMGIFDLLKGGLFLLTTRDASTLAREAPTLAIGANLLRPPEQKNTMAFEKKINGHKTIPHNRANALRSKKGHFICKR